MLCLIYKAMFHAPSNELKSTQLYQDVEVPLLNCILALLVVLSVNTDLASNCLVGLDQQLWCRLILMLKG